MWNAILAIGFWCNLMIAAALLAMLFATITQVHAWPLVAVGAILFFAVLFWVRLAYENR